LQTDCNWSNQPDACELAPQPVGEGISGEPADKLRQPDTGPATMGRGQTQRLNGPLTLPVIGLSGNYTAYTSTRIWVVARATWNEMNVAVHHRLPSDLAAVDPYVETQDG
jgi:hypothetical protein